MPRRRRVAKLRVQPFEYNDDCDLFLKCGWDYFGAHPFGAPVDMDLVERCWREHREELLAEFAATWPGCRPWAWWQFEAPEQAEGEAEADYLYRLGVLKRR